MNDKTIILTEHIDSHLRQCAPHIKQRESYKLMFLANNRIKELENILSLLFTAGCIPEHRAWINKKEEVIQSAIKILKNNKI